MDRFWLWRKICRAMKSTHYVVYQQCYNCMHVVRLKIPLGEDADRFVARTTCPVCKVTGKWCE